MASYIGVTLFN